MSVRDRGPGIPSHVLEKVFDWFESHSLGSQHRGPGIGLSLVRSFVELHGGTIVISSVVGEGTTVTCTFGRAASAELIAAIPGANFGQTSPTPPTATRSR